jgi:hypothetical protein
MKALRAVNGYTIPYSRWSVCAHGDTKKPRIFWIGRGWFKYPTSGKAAWVEAEVPDPPKEPFHDTQEARDAWYEDWMIYAQTHGLPLAACGLMSCDYTLQTSALATFTRHDRYPPAELTAGLKQALGINPINCGCSISYVLGGPFSLDILKLLQTLMPTKGVNFEKWNSEVDQSAKQWLAETYGEGIASAVETLLKWKPDEAAEARYATLVWELAKQRDEAMATCKAVRS